MEEQLTEQSDNPFDSRERGVMSADRDFVKHARQAIEQSERLGGNEAELRHLKEAVRALVVLAEHLVTRLERLEHRGQ